MASKVINVVVANEEDWAFAWIVDGPGKGHAAVF